MSLLSAGVALITLLAPQPSYAQDDDDHTPTGARRAAEWRPSREGLDTHPIDLSATAGIAFFSGGEAVEGDAGFSLELRADGEITGGLYAVGSYLLAVARTDTDSFGDDTETTFLHAPTVGIGYRAEITPEIRLFIEPRIGILLGAEDVAPIGGAAAGAEFQVQPGFLVHARFTGLFTAAEIDAGDFDADLNAIWSIGVGVTFEF